MWSCTDAYHVSENTRSIAVIPAASALMSMRVMIHKPLGALRGRRACIRTRRLGADRTKGSIRSMQVRYEWGRGERPQARRTHDAPYGMHYGSMRVHRSRGLQTKTSCAPPERTEARRRGGRAWGLARGGPTPP